MAASEFEANRAKYSFAPGNSQGGSYKKTQEDKEARKRLKALVSSNADRHVMKMMEALERHEAALRKRSTKVVDGFMGVNAYMRTLQYLNDWSNGKAVETMRTADPEEASPIDVTERQSRLDRLRAKARAAAGGGDTVH